MIDREARDDYECERWGIDSARDELVCELMRSEEPDREGKLKAIFEEYSGLMAELILKSAAIFQDDATDAAGPGEASPYPAAPTRGELLMLARAKVERLAAIRKEKANEEQAG
jgi:hypothetical protein